MRFRLFKTRDKQSEVTPIHTTEQIGPKQALTPEGFLLCSDVPIARTGLMLYGPGETPIKTGPERIARVTRDASALFSPQTVASFNGKPVVNEHPDTDVNPGNWKSLTVGICMNPRQGVDENSDIMIGDLLITDAATIMDIQAGKREVSAGYEADYEQTGEGTGRQTGIIGNHIALVERGRCGPRCAIGDHQPTIIKEHSTMGTTTKGAPASRTRRALPEAVKVKFLDMLEEGLNDAGGDLDGIASGGQEAGGGSGDTHIHIHAGANGAAAMDAVDPAAAAAGGEASADPMEARIGALESGMQQLTGLVQQLVDGAAKTEEAPAVDGEAPVEGDGESMGEGDKPDFTKDKVAKTADAATQDSAALETGFTQLLADAEILVPGSRFPTFDAKALRKATVDTMCQTRKRVMDHLYSSPEGKTLIDGCAGGTVDLGKLDCAATATIFKATAGAKRALNNAANTRDAGSVASSNNQVSKAVGKVTSIAELNKLHADHYAGKTVTAK